MSKIEWTDQTWNPATGCSRVSPGCDHCYMFREYPRLRAMGVRGYEITPDVVQIFPERVDQPLRWRKPRRVFVNSMSDMFHPQIPKEFLERVWDVMLRADQHVYQVLTKRPGRAVISLRHLEVPSHIWLGTSIESEHYARRVDVLARTGAPVLFVSAEPLLGPIDLRPWLDTLSWVIVGGESGPGARPMDLDWARDLREQCRDAGVPFFLKQLGGSLDKRGGDKALLDGRLWREMPS